MSDACFDEWLATRREAMAKVLASASRRRDAGGPCVTSPIDNALAGVLARRGKSYRPLLTLTVAEALGGNGDDDWNDIETPAFRAAAGVECFHLASLAYDDLPAMDNADTRRGAPSLHRALEAVHPGRGAALAVLCAHALTSLGFQTLADSGLSPTAALDLVSAASDAIGPAHMAGGQALDLVGYPAELFDDIGHDEIGRAHV